MCGLKGKEICLNILVLCRSLSLIVLIIIVFLVFFFYNYIPFIHYFVLYKNFTKYDVYLNICTVIGIGLTDFTEKGSDLIIWSKTNSLLLSCAKIRKSK